MTKMIDQWDIFTHNDQSHIMPRYDHQPHDPVVKCWCSPYQQSGLYIHRAADGRGFDLQQWESKQ